MPPNNSIFHKGPSDLYSSSIGRFTKKHIRYLRYSTSHKKVTSNLNMDHFLFFQKMREKKGVNLEEINT